MLLNVLTIIRYMTTIICGTALMGAFAGVFKEKEQMKKLLGLIGFFVLLNSCLLRLLGATATFATFPLHFYIPIVILVAVLFHKKLSISVSALIFAYMCCKIPAWISKLTLLMPTETKIPEVILYILSALISTYLVIRYIANPIHSLLVSSRRAMIIVTVVPFLFCVFDFVTTIWMDWVHSEEYLAIEFFPFLFCIAFLLFVLVYSSELTQRMQLNEEKAILENRLDTVENEMQNLADMDEKTRILRHDMRHHLSLIQQMARENKLDELQDYISGIVTELDAVTHVRYCQYHVLNLLLSHYFSRYEERAAKLSHEINLPDSLPISDIELCALVSNLLENAWNAIAGLPVGDGQISIIMKELSGKLIFAVDNNYPVESASGEALSKQTVDAIEHGYGLKSIDLIAKRHHGGIIIKNEGNVFQSSIWIPME